MILQRLREAPATAGAFSYLPKASELALESGNGVIETPLSLMVSAGPGYVVVAGGANADINGMPFGKLERRDSNPGNIHVSCGGVARNVAENLARLDLDARLVTLLGNDQYGEMILALGRSAGIDMQYVGRSDSAATSTYLSILDETGDMFAAVADMEIMDQLTPARLTHCHDAFANASLIIIDANLPPASIQWITSEFSHCPVFADAVSASKAPALRPCLGAIHTLKTNALEAMSLAAVDSSTGAAADALHEQGVERIFITRGADGVFFSTRDACGDVTAPRDGTPMHNSGGAGDAFLAAIAYAWLADWPLDRTIDFAMAAARVTAAAHAASSTVLSLATIEQALEQHAAATDA